jgi:hypothetical protein
MPSQLKWKGSKKTRKPFFENFKIIDLGLASAVRELKKEV